jgi:RHS repeat-associated protein
MTSPTKAIVWQIESKPFGETLSITGTASLNLRFPGQYFDGETGLHQNWFRDYMPKVGRYLEADPIGFASGDVNLYGYVRNDPVNGVDPEGLESFKACGQRVYEREAGYLKGRNDKYQHCVVACRIMQECGAFAAASGSLYKEARDLRRKGLKSLGDSIDDLKADQAGMRCPPRENCYIHCLYEGYGGAPPDGGCCPR